MKPTALALPILAALALSACAGAKPVPACQLEFLNAAPERPFEKLGEFNEMVRVIPPGGAREALRPAACALGADAVVITKSMVVNLYDHTMVQGYAIRWSATPPAPAAVQPEPAAGAPASAPAEPAQAR
jgi:hypothetical protein